MCESLVNFFFRIFKKRNFSHFKNISLSGHFKRKACFSQVEMDMFHDPNNIKSAHKFQLMREIIQILYKINTRLNELRAQ